MERTRWVLNEVYFERVRQEEKWGEQNHPDVDPILMNRKGGCSPERMAEEYGIPSAERGKYSCERAFQDGNPTWAHILVEEVAEAIDAGVLGPELLREELIQVAAVAVGWIEAIDRRLRNDD